MQIHMKNIGPAIAWYINRVVKLFGNLLSMVIRLTHAVEPNRVLCWAFDFKQYGCNPRYLTEYLLEHNPELEIWWVFRKGVDTSQIDKRIRCIRFRSWQYFIAINTARVLITNARTDPYRIYWHKRPEQQYMMLWHGGVALKRIEKDAEDKLGYSYLRKAKADSRACDLMISGCRMQSRLLREKFWYDGEVLECGIPRNDIFFDKERHGALREKILNQYSISEDSRIVLYAPTFRRNGSIEPFRIDWQRVLPHLQNLFGGDKVTILLRLHPNLIGKVDTQSLTCGVAIDVTLYHDMQELLCVSDMLITDYSSSMFDFTMLRRPCLLYATDIEQYDRGYYFRFDELPYPLARNEEQLLDIIDNFDNAEYQKRVATFFDERIGLFERGTASQTLAQRIIGR